jgi:hypothetical protein
VISGHRDRQERYAAKENKVLLDCPVSMAFQVYLVLKAIPDYQDCQD